MSNRDQDRLDRSASDEQLLPDGWAWRSIDEVAEINRRNPSLRDLPDNLRVTFLPMSAVDAERGVIAQPEKRTLTEVRRGYTSFSEGDVLFAKITPSMENGKAAITEGLQNGIGFGSTEFHVLSPNELTCSEWLFYFIRQESFRSDAKARFSGTAGQLRVPADFLRDYQIPLAPLPEQHRIVAEIETHFTRLDAGVAALKRVQANLRRYKASVLKAACEGRLVPTEADLARAEGRPYEPADALLQRILADRRAKWEAENPGKKYKEPAAPDTDDLPELPEGWVWATAEQLSDETRSITYGVVKLGSPSEGGIPTLRSSNVRTLRIEGDNVKCISPIIADQYRRTILHGGEILVTVRGTLGGVAIASEHFAGFNISREVAMIALVAPVVGPVLQYFIASSPVQAWLMARTRGIAYTGINIATLKITPLPLPPLAEQRRIVAEVERRLSLVQEVEATVAANLKRAERLRQSILKRAFEGRLVAQEAGDAPASASPARLPGAGASDTAML